jgi:hypothetical protein
MDPLLRHAEEILETASEAQAAQGPLSTDRSEYLIAVLRSGSIRMIADNGNWSLSALAAEYGASAVYRVTRRIRSVRVEAWSAGRTCVLTRESPAQCVRGATPTALIAQPCFFSPAIV